MIADPSALSSQNQMPPASATDDSWKKASNALFTVNATGRGRGERAALPSHRGGVIRPLEVAWACRRSLASMYLLVAGLYFMV